MGAVFDEGSTMDESTIFPIPAELLVHIDTEGNNNPDLYQHKLIEDCESKAAKLSKKMNYLQVKVPFVPPLWTLFISCFNFRILKPMSRKQEQNQIDW